MERSVTNELTNFSSTTQGYKMQLSVSQSWTVSPSVPKEYKNAIISALGSWGPAKTELVFSSYLLGLLYLSCFCSVF